MGMETDRRGCEAIGTHGLEGKIDGNFVTIAGPCKGGHTMSIEAARELMAWLEMKLVPDEESRDGAD